MIYFEESQTRSERATLRDPGAPGRDDDRNGFPRQSGP